MTQVSDPGPAPGAYVSAEARKWGKTAVGFIFSATVAGITGLLGFVLWTVNLWLAYACCGVAACAAVFFLLSSISIVQFWIALAKKNPTPS